MRRINLSSVNDDGELTRIQAVTTTSRLISDKAEFAIWVAGAPAGPPASLDIIAHTTKRGALRLGDWEIDVGLDPELPKFFAERKACLLGMGVKQVRLLGCGTAGSELGLATLRALTHVLGPEIDVLGTRTTLNRSDFDQDGLARGAEKKLVYLPLSTHRNPVEKL
jgi:hypothetical protein